MSITILSQSLQMYYLTQSENKTNIYLKVMMHIEIIMFSINYE